MVIDISELQLSKAESPIVDTELGMVTLTRDEHPQKVLFLRIGNAVASMLAATSEVHW